MWTICKEQGIDVLAERSRSGRVEQYAGRLDRDYDGKKSVVIYDYVDSHIYKFDRMYGKRLKAYKQIGYQICTNISVEKQKAGAIYDFESYLQVFERDLREAEKDIIISSPQMNRKKELMEKACEHFMVVDQRIVWYGNMNFLSKEDMEDNLMRVVSGDIAAEIIEITFGGGC